MSIYKIKDNRAIPKTKYMLGPVEDVLKKPKTGCCLVGHAVTLYKKEIIKYFKAKKKEATLADDKYFMPEADILCRLAHARAKTKKYDNINKLLPLYLYPEDCQVR